MIKRVQTGGAQLSGHAPLSGFNKPDDSSAQRTVIPHLIACMRAHVPFLREQTLYNNTHTSFTLAYSQFHCMKSSVNTPTHRDITAAWRVGI